MPNGGPETQTFGCCVLKLSQFKIRSLHGLGGLVWVFANSSQQRDFFERDEYIRRMLQEEGRNLNMLWEGAPPVDWAGGREWWPPPR